MPCVYAVILQPCELGEAIRRLYEEMKQLWVFIPMRCYYNCTPVLVGVMRLLGCPFDGARCLVSEFCLLAVICVDCRCSLSFVFLGGARCLELSSCDTTVQSCRLSESAQSPLLSS